MATQAELAGADETAVTAARELVVAYVGERYPTLDVRGGPLADVVVGPAADALAAVDARAAAQVASLDPEVALAAGGYDETVLAATLAGRGVTRKTAAIASGSIAVHLADVNVMIPAGYRASTADGVAYATTAAARVLAPGVSVTGSDVAAVVVPEGGFAAVVPVAAVATGAAGNRPAGTALTAAQALSGQTAVYLAADAAGGADAESDAALLARLPAATAARTVASAAGAAAVVGDAGPYPTVAAVGFGHAGLTRGRSALTGQSPGRMDVRVRVAAAPDRERVPVTALLIATVPFGRWRFELGTDAAPGRFLVEKVVQRDAAFSAAGYVPTATIAGYDVTAATAPVDVRSAADAALSRYATFTVEFDDPDTSTSGLVVGVATRAYDTVVRAVPGLSTAQNACDADGARAAGGDCLVRAAVPVLVILTAAASVAAGVSLTSAQVAAAVATAVNGNGISTALSASAVAARAAALLPAGTALQLSTFVGSVYPVASAKYTVVGTTGLSVVTDWTIGVGPDAVAFYCDSEGVTATVEFV